MSISLRQMRAARALLDWSQKDLAGHAGLSDLSILNIEKGRTSPQISTMNKIIQAFALHGVEFLESDGVRMKQIKIHHLYGSDGFKDFMNDVYAIASNESTRICIFNGMPNQFIYFLGDEFYQMHATRMAEIKNRFTCQVLVDETETRFIAKNFAEYRPIPHHLFREKTIYIYGNRIGLFSFLEDNVAITVVEDKLLAESFYILFDAIWNSNPVQKGNQT